MMLVQILDPIKKMPKTMRKCRTDFERMEQMKKAEGLSAAKTFLRRKINLEEDKLEAAIKTYGKENRKDNGEKILFQIEHHFPQRHIY